MSTCAFPGCDHNALRLRLLCLEHVVVQLASREPEWFAYALTVRQTPVDPNWALALQSLTAIVWTLPRVTAP
jgi:hypothetical protein